MWLKVVLLLLAALNGLVQARNKLIVVGMSGLRHDYVEKPSLPTFHLFRTNGFHAKKMEIPMVTNSWPSLWTIATGLWPEEHGIIDDNMYDPTIDEPFTAGVSKVDALWFPYKPIWISAEEAGITTAVSGWPGSDIRHGSVKATNFHPFASAEDEQETMARMDDFCAWMYDGADLGMFMLPEPDNTGHETGAESDAVHDALKQNDRLLSYLLDSLEALGIKDTETNIIIVGDHGMVDHRSSDVAYLSNFGVRLGDLRWITSNLFTTGMILPYDDELVTPIYNRLKQNSSQYMDVYLKADIPDSFHIKNHRRTSPILVVPKLGYRIEMTKPHTDLQSPDRLLGMHGYSNSHEQMLPTMLALGPDFEQKQVDKIRSIDIYPLMCSMLELDTCHGTDATIDVPQGMVKVPLTDNRPAKLNYRYLNTGPRKKIGRPTGKEGGSSSAPSLSAYNRLSLLTTLATIVSALTPLF